MPVTNPPSSDRPGQSWETLNHIVTYAVGTAFGDSARLITTDRTGRADAAWSIDADGTRHRLPVLTWADTPQHRDFTLINLGGLIRLYASHPDADPAIKVVTYEAWPAMVEVTLP